MNLQLAKGVRDIPPEEQIVRQRIIETIRNGFESYGFLPLETPVIERYDVLASKYAGGAEILKETFKLTDQGKRQLALRYDLTVPLCRFVGMNPTIKMPFKRYQMGPVFRDGPIKLGRYREFWQVDADIVGARSTAAEAEILSMALRILSNLELDAFIEVNNRKLLDAVLVKAGVENDRLEDFILSVDKLKKIGVEGVKKELEEKGFSTETIDAALAALAVEGTTEEKLSKIEKFVDDKEGIEELREVFESVNDERIVFNPSLARGLAYYTGTVYEAFLKNSEITSSIAAGGRYDRMIGQFLQTKKEYPAVGISFGLEIIADAYKLLGRSEKQSVAKVFIIPINTRKQCREIAEKLRDAGINTDMDIMGRGISKNLQYANSLSIPFVVIAGEDELAENKVTLRDMKTGQQEMLSVEEVIKKLS
ncbi:histidine--tRNA ligase [Candidatus Woesearchaeota archaeon]|nr:MAG: histidine--tRNA ligase [Candidatus Woesearchaeota archaeon]